MSHTSATVVLGERGRMVLPAAIRSELDLHAGEKLAVVVEEDGSIRLRSVRAVVAAACGMWADRGDPNASMVDELIAERRAEAAREDQEERESREP